MTKKRHSRTGNRRADASGSGRRPRAERSKKAATGREERKRTRTKSNLMVFLRPMVIRNQDDSNKLTMDRYDLMRTTQQTAGQPRQSYVMPINDAPVTAPMPTPEPGSPFRGSTVPAPLSMESVPPRGAASAPAAAPPPPAPPPPTSSRGPVGPQQLQMP